MSDENKGAGSDAGGKAGSNAAADTSKDGLDLVTRNAQAREAIIAKHQKSEASPAAEAPKADEGKEKSEIGAPQSESVESEGKQSSVDDKKQNNEKPKGNLEKALQEEREKRKKATLEARQAREEAETLRKQLEESKHPKTEDTEGSDDESDPEKVALRKQLAEERAKREAGDKEKQQADLQEKQKAYVEKVNRVHNELKDEGYLGFKFCQLEIREAILKRFDDGEFDNQDLNDPAIWKTVYIEDVYEKVKDEFPASAGREVLEDKKEAKKKAGTISNPGPAPKKNDGEEKQPTMEDLNKEYLKKRQEQSRVLG